MGSDVRWLGSYRTSPVKGPAMNKIDLDVTPADLENCKQRCKRVLVTLIRDTDMPPADPGVLTIIEKLAALEHIVPTRRDPTAPASECVGWDEKTEKPVFVERKRK